MSKYLLKMKMKMTIKSLRMNDFDLIAKKTNERKGATERICYIQFSQKV